jgi:2,3-bisphosphoglycerate-independent phosphoglycerate mutase
MRSVVVAVAGLADTAAAELNGKSPLEVAKIPTLDALAAKGILGLTPAAGVDGATTRSTAALLGLLGYAPGTVDVSAGGAAAAGLGIELPADHVAALVDLVGVRVDEGGTESASSLAGLHLPPEARRAVTDALAEALPTDAMRLLPGLRTVLVAPQALLGEPAPPAWSLLGRPVSQWRLDGDSALAEFSQRARRLLAAHPACLDARAQEQPVPTDVWVWGAGRPVTMPSFSEAHGAGGHVVAADPVALGLGRMGGLNIRPLDAVSLGAVDWERQLAAVRDAVAHDVFTFVHVAALAEAGHRGDPLGKVRLVERLDAELVAPLMETLSAAGGDWRLMVIASHTTACETRRHSGEPVPFVIGSSRDGDRKRRGKRRFQERDAREHGIFIPEPWTLLDRMLRR